LLERLGLPFSVQVPRVDETPCAGEAAGHLVTRLAHDKANAVARRFPAAVVIGSDQLAVCGDKVVGKPGNEENAIRQLQAFSGQTVHFMTAVSVLCAESGFEFRQTIVTDIRFRDLAEDEILRYVENDLPLDCAGSFKSEAGGISLMNAMRSDDPTAIVGLPLISISEALRQAGYKVP